MNPRFLATHDYGYWPWPMYVYDRHGLPTKPTTQANKEGKAMETKHTPGPWRVGTGQGLADHMGVYDSRCICVALAWRGENPVTTTEERRANARLIAAAPDLLAACKAALDALNLADQDRYDQGRLTSELRQAIANAEKP